MKQEQSKIEEGNRPNIESILKQFDIIEKSLYRAKLPFETEMLQHPVIDVCLWELLRSWKQIENLIREIGPDKFGYRKVTVTKIPELTNHVLDVCPYCGNPECDSDHK